MPLKKLFQRLRPKKDVAHPSVTASVDATEAQVKTEEPIRHQLSKSAIRRAIVEHVQWCALFNDHLSGLTDSVLPDTPSSTDLAPLPDAVQSGLGKWLRENEKAFGTARETLQEIRAEQIRCHTVAKEALRLSRAHRFGQASKILNSDFERSRQRIVQLLRSLEPEE